MQAKEELLSEIDALISPSEETSTVGKSAKIHNYCLLYRRFTDIVQYMINKVKNRERVAFRNEVTNILLSMQLAYGLIEIEEVPPFDNDLSEDSEWIISLAIIIKSHRDNYLKT